MGASTKRPAVASVERPNPMSTARPGSTESKKITARLSAASGLVPLPTQSPTITKTAIVAALMTEDSGPTSRT